MVKGITRQVVVVKAPDPKLFEQAIFLVRDSALSEGEITEETLLREAQLACKHAKQPLPWLQRFLWAGLGTTVIGTIWAITVFL